MGVSRHDALGVIAAGAAALLSDCSLSPKSTASKDDSSSVSATPSDHMGMESRKASGATPQSLANASAAFTFFSEPERAFVEAAIDRLIPNDGLGPGAKESGVCFYIDQQLNGAFGYNARNYRQGPFRVGVSGQGPQLPLNNREIYRLGIAACNRHCVEKYGVTRFAELSAGQMDATLSDMETGRVQFSTVPSSAFFETLYANTIEGFFADPLYGGNRDMAGWKLVGFPGVGGSYGAVIEQYNVRYVVDPVSISTEQQHDQTATNSDHQTVRAVAMRMQSPKRLKDLRRHT